MEFFNKLIGIAASILERVRGGVRHKAIEAEIEHPAGTQPVTTEAPRALRYLNISGSPPPPNYYPEGIMRPYLGERYAKDVIFAAEFEEFCDEDDEALYRRCENYLLAYDVPSLIGEFVIDDIDDISDALLTYLRSRIPGVDWTVKSDWEGGMQKYLLIHDSISAPKDVRTGQPMMLELFGDVSSSGLTQDKSTELENYATAARNALYAGTPPPKLPKRTTISISVATYSNVCFPGVGVPFYS